MAYVLANDQVTFTFDDDATRGFKLVSFARVGIGTPHVWLNGETSFWKAKTFDTQAAAPYSTTDLLPNGTTVVVNESDTNTGQRIRVTWGSVPVGNGDALRVVCTINLHDARDFAEVTISASFVGTPTRWALHEIGPLHAKIELLNDATADAIIPNVRGIASRQPGINLRYDASGSRPSTLFGGSLDNVWNYPVGPGHPMGLWGYYDTTTAEGWMIYVEDWSLEIFSTNFQAWPAASVTGAGISSTHMMWETFQPQPDHILVGNNGQTLGSGYTFCLRPFLGSAISGVTRQDYYVEMGHHYRERLEANPPSWFKETLNKRTDLSSREVGYAAFVDINAQDEDHEPGDGKPGDIVAMIAALRTGLGASGMPIHGFIEAPHFNIQDVGETPDGDLHGKIEELYDLGCRFALWRAGLFGPFGWSIRKWHREPGDQAETRWQQTNHVDGAYKRSRTGFLAGGGDDRLLELSNGSGYGYRARVYPVTNWNGSNTVTVTGAPSSDGFSGELIAMLMPASASARMASARVSSLGATTVVTTGVFTDYLGATVTPAAGDTVAVATFDDDNGGTESISNPPAYCLHAIVGAAQFFTRLRTNTHDGMFELCKIIGRYWDVFAEPAMSKPTNPPDQWCYRRHDSDAWAELDADYVNHPQGGGSWYIEAKRAFVAGVRESQRAVMIAAGEDPMCMLGCEYMSEDMQDLFDLDFRVHSSGDLWRNCAGFSSAVHLYRAIPLWDIVHAGRNRGGRALLQEFSTSIGIPSSPYNLDALHRVMGYFLGYEWPYGTTLPTISFFQSGAATFKDLFDDSIYDDYTPTPGPTKVFVKHLRDYWVQIVKAGSWLQPFMPFGRQQPLGVIDGAGTSTTTGYADATPFTTQYYSFPVVYPKATTPRIIHANWLGDDGSVRVVCSNWTDTAGNLVVTLPIEYMGLGAPNSSLAQSLAVRLLDADQRDTGTVAFDYVTGKLTLTAVPALTVVVVSLIPSFSASGNSQPGTMDGTVQREGALA